MKRILQSILAIAAFGFGANAQNVNIPDADFKAFLIGNTAINTTNDTEITTVEASAFTGAMNLNGLIYNAHKNISDLTGIEAFTELTSLTCQYLKVTTVDISSNTKLQKFNCSQNQITAIDVSKNINLTDLAVSHNTLTSLDVSNNIKLTQLSCDFNQLTSLDVSKCVELEKLATQINKLSSLDVSKNPKLELLHCASNMISSLDLSNNVKLSDLQCQNLQLTALDVSKHIDLTYLGCGGNQITKLDLSNNVKLIDVNCYKNALTQLNMANGNNTEIFNKFNATKNPDLKCIQVDDASYSTTNWTKIDEGASFNVDCVYVGIDRQVNNIDLSIYPNPATSQITVDTGEKIESIAILTVMAKTVKTIVPTNNTIDISGLTKGVYFLQIQTEKGLVSKRFMKE